MSLGQGLPPDVTTLTIDEGLTLAAVKVRPGRSPSKIAMERLRNDKLALVCIAVVLFFVIVAILAPVLTAWEGQNFSDFNTDLVDQYGFPTIGTNSQHWFGVEPKTGRDLFAQWVYGARPSLEISAVAALTSSIIGVTAGLIAGFSGGWIDRSISWVVDFVLSLPYLLVAIAIIPVAVNWRGGVENLSPTDNANIRFYGLIFVLVFFGWAGLSRLIRGEVISLREREFISAAKVLGVPTRRVLTKELLPNLVAPIVISLSLALPGYIVAEAGLSFLGVGLIEPIPSWGQMISKATVYYQADPLYLWLPVLGVSLLTLALSWLGDSIRDAFDPKTRR